MFLASAILPNYGELVPPPYSALTNPAQEPIIVPAAGVVTLSRQYYVNISAI